MVAPINYSGLLTQIDLTPLRQGIQMSQQKQALQAEASDRQQARQLAQAKFEYDHQKDVDYLEAVKAYQANPTAQGMRDLAIRFPDKSADLLKAGESYDRAVKQDMVEAASGTLGALAAGNTDLAVQTLTNRAKALETGGVDTSHTQAAIDMIKSGNVKGATAYLSYVMSGLVGADHTAGIMDTLGIGGKAEDRRIDDARQAAGQAETARHNRVMEGQGAQRVDLSRQAGARAATKAAGGGKKGKGAFSNADLDALLQ